MHAQASLKSAGNSLLRLLHIPQYAVAEQKPPCIYVGNYKQYVCIDFSNI